MTKKVKGKEFLSNLKFYSDYAKWDKEKERYETWEEACEKVMDTHRVKYAHKLKELNPYIDEALEVYKDKMVLASQRNLQFRGEQIFKHNARLFNCVSTYMDKIENLHKSFYLALCGCGIGINMRKYWTNKLPNLTPRNNENVKNFIIPDTIEGWADAAGILISSFCKDNSPFPEYEGCVVRFDYSEIRPKGAFITGGFKAPGHDGLKQSLELIEALLEKETENGEVKLRGIIAYDIFMHLSDAVLSGGIRRCIAKGSKVLIENGTYKNIEDIQIGDKVKTLKGYHPVTNKFIQGKQNTITIDFKFGSLSCTENHKIAIIENDEIVWKQAKDIQKNDNLIFINENFQTIYENKLPYFEYKKPFNSTTCKDIIIPELTKDIAYFIGDFQANGYVYLKSNAGRISIAVPANNKDKVLLLKSIIEKFNVNVSIREPSEKDKSYKIVVKSKQLATFLSENVKKPKEILHIPKFILNASDDIKWAYVSGVFCGDGSAKNRPLDVCSSIYKEFLEELQILLNSLGVFTYIRNRTYKSRKEHWKDIYSLNLESKENYQRFSKKLLFTKKHHCKVFDEKIKGKYIIKDNYTLIPVKNIINNDIVETFDIEVENEHSFVCEGILVHNSASLIIIDSDDEELLNAKNGNWRDENPQRGRSNNSVALQRGEFSLKEFEDLTKINNGMNDIGFFFTNNIYETPNPCQIATAKVLTPEGIREFKDIKEGSVIWSSEGWTNVIKKWSNGVKPVYKYQTTAGIFYGTENHKIVQNGEKIEVKDAESIDIIHGKKNSSYIIDAQDVIDGLVIGDGSVHKASNNLVVLHIGKDDTDYFTSEVHDYILKHRPGICETAYSINTTISSEELPKTYERKVPERFIKDPNKLVGFLRGIFSANGSVCGNRITLKTTSKNILEDVQLMLNSIGIKSYYTTNKSSNIKFKNGEYICKESYDLNITSDRDIFMNTIGFIQNYKTDKVKIVSKSKTKCSHEIIHKEYLGEEEVFDITVDNKSHTYWTQGCNVSNCVEIVFTPILDFETEKTGFALCNLVEINGKSSLVNGKFNEKIFYKQCKVASIIATLQAGYTSLPYLGKITEEIVKKESLIGVSITGWMDNEFLFDEEILQNGLNIIKETNEEIAKIIDINPSARLTAVKPSGNCISTDSKIRTEYGSMTLSEVFDFCTNKEIESGWNDVEKNLKVYDENNDLQDVEKLYLNGIKDVYEITFEDGNTYKFTGEHKLKTINGWKDVKDITVDDEIIHF